ncbi:MAG TPA: NAD(P)/FAD-dependent oxidoreductase [Thermomicrobiales bacterium]|nr:NAD(P)/FAD-dependent oxidoreductase [Thermomicrobiales bacterium]
MYDAIVVGARCAGSPTAMLLARQGYKVLLLDKARFPSDTMSVHYIHQAGGASLQRWGLLERVAATGCPPLASQRIDFGPVALTGSPPPADGVSLGYAPRRVILDHILVQEAVASGAELRERFTVKDLVFDGDRVTGVRGSVAGGETVTERARIVIGADGLHSTVAKAVQAPAYEEAPALTCAYYAYWEGLPVETVELYSRPERAIIAAPTNDDKSFVIIYWPRAMFHEVRSDIEGHYMRALDLVPGLAERVRNARRVERFVGTADLPNYYRKPYGPGWALVGDAGYHKDPITAEGITDAFRDAELLSEAIHAGFSGAMPLEDTMAAYEHRRNEASMPIYQMTLGLASLQPPPPDQAALIGALVGNQEQTNRFIGTLAGTVPIPEFFSSENVGRIFEEASHGVPA